MSEQAVTAEAYTRRREMGTLPHCIIPGQRYLALDLQQLIVAYDVECMVFGGGVS